MNWLYLALDLGTLAIPFAFSFDKRISFYKEWKYLFPALIFTAAFFIIWDYFFTSAGVWKFNPDFVLGIYIGDLPAEEWLFFLFIPYACLFIYESLNYYFPKDPFRRAGKPVALTLGIICLTCSVFVFEWLYTFYTLAFLGIMFLFLFKMQFMGRFFMMFLVSMIPFGIVNGILTGMPVLIYNDMENCRTRIGTIPVEDIFYSMLLLLMNVAIYEKLKGRSEPFEPSPVKPAKR